jgi:UPF0755 protein
VNKGALVVAIIFSLVAFACGFVGVAGTLMVTQPAVRGSTAQVRFQVMLGDSTAAVATRLQSQGLIRNATIFRQLARYRKLDTKLEPGVYTLSPGMTMDAIIQSLLVGQPIEQLIAILPGHRVTEYPAYFTALPRFNAKTFLQTATTGVLPDGSKLSDAYWYLPPKAPKAAYALEGYLFPDTYYFNTSDTDSLVIKRLLNAVGEHLCPGPDDAHPDAYLHDQAQCKAHAVQVGPNKTSVFTEMEARFNTKDDVQALYQTLTLASIVVREAGKNADDIPGVANVYYNRYALKGSGLVTPLGDTIVSLDADPTAQYARDTDAPPADGKWWVALADAAKNVDPGNPYNTANPDNKGLPPGPIAAPRWDDIRYVAIAGEPPTPYYYFFHDPCGKAHYAKTNAEQSTNINQFGNAKCP